MAKSDQSRGRREKARERPPSDSVDLPAVRADEPPGDGAAAPVDPSGPAAPSLPFRVVGIGASAGGLEAVTQLLGHLPPDTGVAFVLVQHLDPEHESLLVPLLTRVTPMPVVTASDQMRIEPDHLYVIPPDGRLTVESGRLRLEPRGRGTVAHLTIDSFLRSLAEDQRHLSIGIVLSGSDTDGALGVAAIKEQGGVVFAQEPSSAGHAGMPRHAIATGCVDLIGTPIQLAHELRRLASASPDSLLSAPPVTDGALRQIFRLLQSATDVDFSLYKPTTIERRLSRRMVLAGTETLGDYTRYVQAHPSEMDSLYQDLLINVTRFFRDTETFEALRESAWPSVIEARRGADRPVRVWVPGCSTGEECYSLAICLFEYLAEASPGTPVQIFGTDVSESVLERARAGIYPENITLDVSPARLRRFFTKVEGGFQIAKPLRDSCIFARQNLVKDPPFSGLDLISCRNVLIYLTTQAQRRILPVFHFALRPTGFLVLGTAETIAGHSDLFRIVDKTHNLYAKEPVPTRFDWDVTRRVTEVPVPGHLTQPRTRPPAASDPVAVDPVKEADRLLLQSYAPPGVLVNDALDIIHFRGETGPYLTQAPGQASLNLLRMLRPGLLPGVPRALRAARGRAGPVRRGAGRIELDGRPADVTVEVLPIQVGTKPTYYLVLFEGTRAPGRASHAEPLRTGASRAARGRLAELEAELVATKDALRTIVDEQASANEELRSANEEVIAANEELHATNEELEAAREELQATNEELSTVNEQLQNRNRELGQLTNDLTNLLASLNMPILMVGRDLRFRRITPLATKVLNVRPTDIGRPVGEIRMPLDGPPLDALIRDVIDTLAPKDLEVRDADGRWYTLRVRPYKTAEQQIDGAVVVLVDIDSFKTVTSGLQASREYAEAIVAVVRQPLVVLDGTWRIRSANRAFQKAFNLSPADADGKALFEIGGGQWSIPTVRQLLEDVRRDHGSTGERQLQLRLDGPDARAIVLTARRLTNGGGSEPLVLLAVDDQTGRAAADGERAPVDERLLAAERDARQEAEAATRAKDAFLATLSHELRTPLTAMLGWVRILSGGKLDDARTRQALDAIERNTTAQIQLIEDLLDVSRITSGNLRLDYRPVDLGATVSAAVDVLRPAAQAKRIRVDTDLRRVSGLVLGDRDRLQQVIWNLLANAIKFNRAGGFIGILVDEQDNHARIRVHDDGLGIEPETLPHVFDRFRQADSLPTRAHGGLGLGLSIVRHIVELHGGTVRAESDGKAKGAVFTIELPLVTMPAGISAGQPGGNPAIAAGVPADEGEWLAGVRVMVVDDEADAREILTAVLQQYGARVTAVGSAREALESFLRERPDVLVADIAMPEEDGYDLIRKVRALPPEGGGRVPAVAVSAYARREDAQRALTAGYQVHIPKPVEPAVLGLAVAQTMGRAKTG